MTIDPNTTIGQIVTDKPSRARLFERLGIDYCCGGGLTLAAACEKQGLIATAVLDEVRASDAACSDGPPVDWEARGAGALADHIEQEHHAYLKREVPRLQVLTEKVAAVHGGREPSLIELRDVYADFAGEMIEHMMKEERVLFPWIRTLAAGKSGAGCGGGGGGGCGCGGGGAPTQRGIENPVRMMMIEHEHSGDALAKMRALTGGFTPPPGACNTYVAMLGGLAELEADTHAHVHKENSILFPMAVKLEAASAANKP